MQFEDAKKKFEIIFDGIRNKGCGSYPMFKMIMERPVQGEARFEVTGIRTQQGHTGINVSQYSGIAKALNSKGKDVLIVVAPEAIEYVRKAHEEERNKLIEESKIDPETWRMWHGCDTGRMYISPNTEIGWEFRPDLEKVKDTLEKEFYTTPTEFNTGIRDERGNILVSHAVVMGVYNKIIANKAVKKAAKQTEKDVIFQKAKEIGEKQILERYTVECSDPREECDIDIVTIWAMPDGTTKKDQVHTW